MSLIHYGNSPLSPLPQTSSGDFVRRGDDHFYRIDAYHRMPPFFMSVVSGWDHWMFVSSTGGLTCGRNNADNALFPFEPDDKIHDAGATTGPLSILLVEKGDRTFLWKPLGEEPAVYATERNLYKNLAGNRLIFEEANHDLGLIFSYSWACSDRYGFVRNVSLRSTNDEMVQVRVLDGLRNLLPWGVTRHLQSTMSTLVDAYKQADKPPDLAAGIYSLTSILTDRAEPSEALRASFACCIGLDDPQVLLSEDQVAAFSAGAPVHSETVNKGKRGAFFVHSAFPLAAGEEKSWCLLADVSLGPAKLPARLREIRRGLSAAEVEADVSAGTARLAALVGSADGSQISADRRVTGRHFSNTLFNIMRGGVFSGGYRIPQQDFVDFVTSWHGPLRDRASQFVESLHEQLSCTDLVAAARATGDPDLERLALEYLPLTFSRRHGDPSRPWNAFSIELRGEDGRDSFNYQGNWRDIFQNWRGLALSFPAYIENFIGKFLNASTPDGHNPYRISRTGFSWETHDPQNSWSNIGYWGDHQINYLLDLLECCQQCRPGSLATMMDREIFVYANVPYRIRSYEALIGDPRHSVDYDETEARSIAERVKQLGADGRLAIRADGTIHRANLLEKLLLPVLAKIAAFVPGGGIWMNTQRPEWNDANNALAGYGLSMVTLCYLRRFLLFFRNLIEPQTDRTLPVSAEVAAFFASAKSTLEEYRGLLDGPVDDRVRKAFMDQLGRIAQSYRDSVYSGFSGRKDSLDVARVRDFTDLALDYLNHSIGLNRRDDGLFHSYNLVRFEMDGYGVDTLDEMLEGQVAALNSGYLEPDESLALLDALRSSRLYRPDQNSYMLYPDRELPPFLAKNTIPRSRVEENPWLKSEVQSGCSRYLVEDIEGEVHFKDAFRNARELRAALAADPEMEPAGAEALCATYESVFKHRHFTGRSSAMYKYEGLGCIYWHMVSKLLLATAELTAAAASDVDSAVLARLCAHFDAIRDGLGIHKSPDEFGAFPTDPYSHTPRFGGVQQPGMTGQVKEDILSRFTELGVQVEDGEVSFRPVLLRRDEFLEAAETWTYSTGGEIRCDELPAAAMAFSLCGVPVVYRIADAARIEVFGNDAAPQVIPGTNLGPAYSELLFRRQADVRKLVVYLPEAWLR